MVKQVTKALGGVEDLLLGSEVRVQQRGGAAVNLTGLAGTTLPLDLEASETIADAVTTSTTGIATNAGNIATNNGNIATNATDIATNTTDIATNRDIVVANEEARSVVGVYDWDAARPFVAGSITNRLGLLYTALTDNTNKAPEAFIDVDWKVTNLESSVPAVAELSPVGSLVIMDGDVVPNGHLKINGASLSRITFADLWVYAQTITNFVLQATKDADPTGYSGYYGDGDGATTFTLPDRRGLFSRAWDNGRGIDPARGIGSYQADDFKSHVHDVLISGDFNLGDATPNGTSFSTGVFRSNKIGSTGGTETRPMSIADMYCVKY